MNSFYKATLMLFLVAVRLPANAQTTPEPGYSSFVLDGTDVWLLMTNGVLSRTTWAPGSTSAGTDMDTAVVTLAQDRRGTIIVGTRNRRIRQYDKKTQRWSSAGTYAGNLTGILFDSKNEGFLITSQGIVELTTGTTYFPDSARYLNHQTWNRKTWFGKPVYWMDQRDQIWVGFDYGEWGGDVFAFDTYKRIFLPLSTDSVSMSVHPVSAFCETPQGVCMASGLSHMFMTHGAIIRFTDGVGYPVFLSKDRETPEKAVIRDPATGQKRTQTITTWKGGQFIGPIAYNPADHCLYFYSQDGMYKGDVRTDLTTLSAWQLVVKPTLHWTGGRLNAVGPAMNVLTMCFDPTGTLLFLTEQDGLGVYSRKTLRYVK